MDVVVVVDLALAVVDCAFYQTRNQCPTCEQAHREHHSFRGSNAAVPAAVPGGEDRHEALGGRGHRAKSNRWTEKTQTLHLSYEPCRSRLSRLDRAKQQTIVRGAAADGMNASCVKIDLSRALKGARCKGPRRHSPEQSQRYFQGLKRVKTEEDKG